uniref:Uncharacterized protein n=1 Tax=viral metagenome TaxID=1070528 RepID=A0A6M3K1R0_9ZZZZ
MNKISKLKINFIFVFLILFTVICFATWFLVKSEKENDILKAEIMSYEAKLADCNDTVLTVRAAHQWIPLLEQTLPNLTKREMDALSEQIKQIRQRKGG